MMMNANELQARLLALREKANERVACPEEISPGVHITAVYSKCPNDNCVDGTIPDPSLAWLRGVLDGVPKVEGEVCRLCKGSGWVALHDPADERKPLKCGDCHGTGRIGAKPAIEGLLVPCTGASAPWVTAISKRSGPHPPFCPTCGGANVILHPLVRQLAEADEEEAIVGMIERRLRAVGADDSCDWDSSVELVLYKTDEHMTPVIPTTEIFGVGYPLYIEALLDAMEAA